MNRRDRRRKEKRDDRIQGGCPDCRAYFTVRGRHGPVFEVTVHHDHTCPALRAPHGKEDK